MLQIIRERLTGWFAIFILGAIALTLVATFGNIDTGFTPGSTAASVNGEEISMQDFRRLYDAQRRQWEQTYRAQIPEVLSQSLADEAIESLVRNRVVSQHVQDQGYRVNDAEVIAAIETQPAFQIGGRFSQPAYESLLAAQGISPRRYEYDQRQSMEITQFIEGIGFSAFYTPTEFGRYMELDGERRDADWVILPASNWADEVEVTEERIAGYYELNQQAYMTEESASVDFIAIDFADIVATIEVSEADARAYYDANPQEFAGPEERQASHILIPLGDDEVAAATRAEELKAELDNGADFAALAAENSADTGSAEMGGSLGWLGFGDSPAPEFEDALFALEVGEVSAPVRTTFGYHLIRLDGLRPGNARSFAEARDELIQRLREQQAAELFGERVDELDEQAFASVDGLADVAEALGEPLQNAPRFTRQGGEPLGFSPALVSAVFSLEVLEDGENSPVISVGEGRAVVVNVREYFPAEPRPLAEVRDEIESELREAGAIAAAAREGRALVEELNSGAQVELPAGAAWNRAAEVRRGDQSVPVDLAAALFRAPKPEALEGPGYLGLPLSSGDFAIYRVLMVRPGSAEMFAAEDREMRQQQLANRLGGSQATALVEELVETASVRVADDLLGTDAAL